MHAPIHVGVAQCVQPEADQPLLAFGQLVKRSPMRSGLPSWLRARSSKHSSKCRGFSEAACSRVGATFEKELLLQAFVYCADLKPDPNRTRTVPGGFALRKLGSRRCQSLAASLPCGLAVQAPIGGTRKVSPN